MTTHFTVLGGDRRQFYLAQELSRIGFEPEVFGVPGMENTRPTAAEALARAGCVILPMPALDAEGFLRGDFPEKLSPSAAAKAVPAGAVVFGGKLGEAKALFSHAEDLAEWEPLAVANAVPTAEGAIRLAMEATDCTLQGCRCLVVGAGRIGLCLARRLRALGAEVTVTARKERDLARIRADGLTADLTGRYGLGLRQYDCIFNTVPAQVFDRTQTERFAPECAVIELASAPGGFPPGTKVISGAGLPGRDAPKTAGLLILDAVLQHLRREERSGKNG